MLNKECLLKQSQNMRICDLERGQIGRDKHNNYWLAQGNLVFHNDLGIPRYPNDYDAEVEIVEKQKLKQNQDFVCLTKIDNKLLATAWFYLIFQIADNGWRWRVRCENYKLSVDSYYPSTDPRAGYLLSSWTIGSGKIFREISLARTMRVIGEENPKLIINQITRTLTVPAQ